LTAILTGGAYAQSARMAASLGPFAAFDDNRTQMLRVIRNHRRAAYHADPIEYEGVSTPPAGIDPGACPRYLLEAARSAWDEALQLGEEHGFRNAQVSAIAPTGTIGLLMDCDTTGVEPDFALVKFKKLAGGGYFKIINQSVPPALEAIGYTAAEIDEIVSYATGKKTLDNAPGINSESLLARGFGAPELAKLNAALESAMNLEGVFTVWVLGKDFVEKVLKIPETTYTLPGFSLLKHIGFTQEDIDAAELYACGTMGLEGAPILKTAHYPIFDTATPSGKNGVRAIPWQAHIGMMAAVQPFVTGAISKTINMPNSATYDDVKGAYMLAWKSAVKSIALYRDGSKLSQPLSSFAPGTNPLADTILAVEKAVQVEKQKSGTNARPAADAAGGDGATATGTGASRLMRKTLPNRRSGYTQKAKIGGQSIFIRTGEYDDGSLGEIFLDMHKEGAAFRSLLNSFAIAVSLGLQYGVPLEEYVDAFTFSKFEPNGPVQGHDYVKIATSVIDYIFRDLAISYLGRNDLGQVKPEDLLATGTKAEAQKSAKADKELAAAASSSSPKPAQTPKQKSRVQAVKDALAAIPGPAAKAARPQKRSAEAAALEARAKGYEGDPCPNCGSFTLIRNGTCFKCDTCGGTTGCS
jgi:ribonucleoside-diphosphate reductase alpha chain